MGRILADDTESLVICLHAHDGSEGEPSHETRTGLVHAGLVSPSRTDLRRRQEHPAKHGVERAAADRPLTQSPIADEPYGSVLVFCDRDDIQLDLEARQDQPVTAGAAI